MMFQSPYKICRDCIGEVTLADAVEVTPSARCSYRGEERECAQIKDIAEIALAKTFAIGKSITRRRRNHFDLATTEIEVVLKDMFQYHPDPRAVDFGFADLAAGSAFCAKEWPIAGCVKLLSASQSQVPGFGGRGRLGYVALDRRPDRFLGD